MCETAELETWARNGLTRRQIGVAGASTLAVAACAPMAGAGAGASSEFTERMVTIPSPAGTIDGEFFHRSRGKAPGVILWPDIAGIRPAKREMARRLAAAGYAVLLANPYFRDVAGQQFTDFADFAGNGGWGKVTPWRGRFDAETILADTRAIAGWLREQDAVDASRGIGAQGYCMTGSFALIAPAALPEVKAGASFHGGGLVREDARSPHRMIEAGNRYLIAIARNDDAKAPGEKDALRAAAAAARVPAEIEVYPADHGWCVPDSPSYDRVEADKAWTRLLETYRAAL
ncbi:dienelactone hydrolase family protein [Qipengyuania sediminis]|uniref:dienelactone hydrolase family protein n=1 Tax=Qipengyuania sediminis TaxID=1532023 RepID=UPI001059BCC9|nr:dienelactone hydrolase family protein [Qipengyuania sediminis]